MSYVVCKLPKAGLGNQLFPLVHAAVFARLNNLPLIVTGYNQIKIGPYLRMEKSKRRYTGFFKFEKNYLKTFIEILRVRKLLNQFDVVPEHELIVLDLDKKNRKVFLFEKLPTYHDYFHKLKSHRSLAIELLREMINDKILSQVDKLQPPQIGVHIRMGDFRKLEPGEQFRGGHVRTPESYFINIINGIREIAGSDLLVTVFTDGYREEFDRLFALENINIADGNTDIVDMLLLSKSEIIVVSTGSTFSYWSGFLSNAPLIMHPDHIHSSIRQFENGANQFEGGYENSISFFNKFFHEKGNN